MSQEISDDERKVVACLDGAHNKGKICLTFPEVVKCAKISRSRTKVALALATKDRVISENHTATVLYYLRNRVVIK